MTRSIKVYDDIIISIIKIDDYDIEKQYYYIMEKTILAIGLLMLVGTLYNVQSTPELQLAAQFTNYQATFNKQYSGSELLYRLQVYEANLADIKARNQKLGREIFGETQFTDLTDEEFAATYLTLKVNPDDLEVPKAQFENVNATPIDWRTRGAVNKVKDQGQCGSCWAFSTTGVLEGFYKVQTGELPDLSEQQLVDCSTLIDFNQGCDGGMPSRALNYVKRNGLTTQDAYPYEHIQNKSCKIKGGAYKVAGSTAIAANEAAHQAALQNGPISVAVKASDWKNYKPKGDDFIFPDSACTGDVNHAVLAVGFTSEALIVKNSWNTVWGVDGYIYLQGGKNTCSVWDNSVVPK
ncbi:unnamed protein product (macronuclear) [Paramecium tetraurelia]|uniref:cathepsin L n=1 Tax=Paramecium tetraurelia TaxID=5888 RepID=A0CNM8_PARTE|nr:uncharacterized protein GSPATT00008837001 [Paramecium tetraurelia]CAK72395.1 unnamed protein product [Paramecium tetraurelia]|eukprot:XP_001439792.1 hypothetical protein (macronuclear) [Paramecium tetraurelia strain d4-2]